MERPANPDRYLTLEERDRLEAAVAEVEQATSAELKVVIVRHCWDDIRRKAGRIFRKLGLDQTEQRNCALLMLVTTDREFLIYGDEGIHAHVGLDFWDDVRDAMASHFRMDEMGEGLCTGVRLIGGKLAAHFPWSPGDANELPDEVAYED